MAKELLNRPDEVITATNGEKEFTIENIKKISTNANYDDSVTYWTLKLKEIYGNVKR